MLIISPAVNAISEEQARHLLVRTGFDASPKTIAEFKPLSYENAVNVLLGAARTAPVLRPPASILKGKAFAPARTTLARAAKLKGWWIREMRVTPSPLTERMTLFWHNHFACALGKVASPQLMYRQNALLRKESLGNFRRLLHKIARDPAMLIFLDAEANQKDHANKVMARQVLARFTLGDGHFKEQDLRDAARAFTGWRVNHDTGRAEFDKSAHDPGMKVVLGRKGRLDGSQVIEAALARPHTAEYIVEGLWREFVSETVDPKEVRRLAASFRKDYEIKPLLRSLLMTKAFRSSSRRGQLIKSPIELLVGSARQFDLPVWSGRDFAEESRLLGQDPFDPPDENGWKGGSEWITPATLIPRQETLARMLRGSELNEGSLDLPDVFGDMAPTRLTRLLLAVPPLDPVPTGLSNYDLAVHLVQDPAYQLK